MCMKSIVVTSPKSLFSCTHSVLESSEKHRAGFESRMLLSLAGLTMFLIASRESTDTVLRQLERRTLSKS